jgi:hypothetical protein
MHAHSTASLAPDPDRENFAFGAVQLAIERGLISESDRAAKLAELLSAPDLDAAVQALLGENETETAPAL